MSRCGIREDEGVYHRFQRVRGTDPTPRGQSEIRGSDVCQGGRIPDNGSTRCCQRGISSRQVDRTRSSKDDVSPGG